MSIAQVEDVEALLGRSLVDGEQRRALRLLDLVDSIIVGYLPGISLEPVTGDVFELDGTEYRDLRLPRWPITSVASIVLDGTVVPSTTYKVRKRFVRRNRLTPLQIYDGRIYPFEGWGFPTSRLVVTYDHGYDPVDGRLVIVAAEVVRNALVNPEQVHSEQLGDHQIVFHPNKTDSEGMALTAGQERILDSLSGVNVGTLSVPYR
jgi:hypothetical protein